MKEKNEDKLNKLLADRKKSKEESEKKANEEKERKKTFNEILQNFPKKKLNPS